MEKKKSKINQRFLDLVNSKYEKKQNVKKTLKIFNKSITIDAELYDDIVLVLDEIDLDVLLEQKEIKNLLTFFTKLAETIKDIEVEKEQDNA